MRSKRIAENGGRNAAILGSMIAFLILLSAVGAAESSDAGSITGQVLSIDGAATKGIPGIGLRLDGAGLERPQHTITQAGGRYSFTDLKPGEYILSVESPGFDAQPATIDLNKGGEISHDITLSAEFKELVDLFLASNKTSTAKYAALANLQLVATGQARQVACPLTGGKLNSQQVLKVSGVKVAFCCGGCPKKVAKASPATVMPTTMPIDFTSVRTNAPALNSAPMSNGTTSIIGTTLKSWKTRIPNIKRPCGASTSPRC